ncbi:MAG: hypothetical protein EOP88_03330 [Verrucomicrobiaceae bacterium]|nr:MAG: hypothetical protein EOP88_03330 [Verrucomicrobiaceae bacterium]
MKPKKSLFSRSGHAAAFVIAVTFSVAGQSFAADYDWNAATADFNNAANWSIGGSPAPGVPGNADTANVANGGHAQWTTNLAKTVLELRVGSAAAGTVSISGGNTFTSSGNVLVGRQNGSATGTLNVSGAGTIFNITSGNTHVGTVSTAVGVTGAGATGVLNISSGAVYNHTPNGDESFIIGNNTPAVADTPGQAGTYKGTLNVDGGTLNVLNGSRLYVAQSPGSVGEVTVTNNGAINVTDDWLVIGRGGQGKLTLASGTITKSGGNNFVVGDLAGTGVVDHTGGTLAVNGGELFVGLGVGTTGTYNLKAGATVNVANWTAIGRSGGTGTLNIDGGTITKTGGGQFMVGARDNGRSDGIVNQNGGTLDIVNGELWIGQNANDQTNKSTGVYNLNAGTVNVNSWIGVGREGGIGTLNVAGGTLTKTGGNGDHMVLGQGNSTNTGTLNVTNNGIVDIKFGQLWVSENSPGEATISGNGELRVPSILVGRFLAGSGGGGLLNLDGGTLKTGRIFGELGNSTVEFNGTAIQATGNQDYFVENIDTATIQAGGFKVDTNGFNLVVGATRPSPSELPPQVLIGSGGITKSGTGSLNLVGAQAYTGPTVISSGKLTTSTASSAATGPITVGSVGNPASLGLNLVSFGQKIEPTAFAITQGNIDLNLAGAPETQQPPLDVNGTLTLNGAAGTNVINIASDTLLNLFEGDSIPLIGYNGTIAGTGFSTLKVGTLPVGLTGVLVSDTANKQIKLNITRLSIPTWRGQESSIWNTTAQNWFNTIGSGGNTNFVNGDPVTFTDDADAGRFTVQLPGTVSPGAYVLFNNSTNNYALTGAGKISGTTRLIKRGTGSVTLGTAANDFTGGVLIEGGSVVIGSLSNGGAASPLGAGAAAPANLNLSGGTLSYTGATATSNRGFTVGAADGGIEVTNAAANLTLAGSTASTAGGLVKKGGGTLTLTGSGAIGSSAPVRVEAGKLTVNGTGATPAQVVTAGEIWIGNTPATPAALEITGATVTSNSWLAIGRGNGSTGNVSSLTLTNSTLSVNNISTGYGNGLENNNATQNITIAGSTLNNTAQTLIAETRGSTTNITVSGASSLNTREVQVAMGGGAVVGATAATITLQNTATWNVGTEANISYASIGRDGGTGNLIVKDDAKFLNFDDFSLGEAGTSTGTLTIQNNAIVNVRTPLLGRGDNSTALINQSGGTFSNRGDNNFQIGVNGDTVFNLSGGVVNANGYTSVSRFGASTSSLNISGGTYNQAAADRLILVGEEGNGTLKVSGTGTLQANGGLRVGFAGSGVGTVNQEAGTINVGTNVILGENGKGTVNLSGGQFNANTTGTVNFVVGNVGGGQGTLNVSGTADLRLMNNASLRVGNTSSTQNNTVTQTGGNVTFYSNNGTTVGGTGAVVLGLGTSTGLNTYELAGGTLTTGAVRSEASTSKLILNGGTLKAAADNATFVSTLTSVEVGNGGAVIDSNAHNVTVVNALTQSGNGGLVKNGAGVLTLAGANTYIGNTVINAGGVTLADDAQLRFLLGANGVTNSISGTGAATLNGDFNIVTTGAAVANGNSWTLVAGPVNETYGASFSVIGFSESGNVWTKVDGGNTWTFSEATGVLTLTTGGVVDPYATWTNTYFPGVTDQNIIGRNADPDGDGSSNALEFALGGVPNSGANGPKVYSIQADSSDGGTEKELLLTIAVRAATPAFSVGTSPSAAKDGVTYTIQGSLDLTGFNTGVTAVDVVAPATAPTPPTGYEYRTFSLNGSNNLTGKGFLRVRVN